MKTSLVTWLSCPLDGAVLSQQAGRLSCAQGHSFDIARQGYVNLLPVQNKKSRQPGDSKEMVAARSAFLESGVYQPIVAALVDQLLAQLPDQGRVRVMDAGCGEGYYTAALAQALSEARPALEVEWLGLDISKYAIQAAARRDPAITWVVGSNRQPPVAPHSLDLILCAFGFHCFDGFNAALKPDGRILLVDPGEKHLLELREVIYPEVRQRPPASLDAAFASGLQLQRADTLTFSTGPLANEQIGRLLTMTPHLFRASRAGKVAAAQLDRLALTVDVVFRWLGREV